MLPLRRTGKQTSTPLDAKQKALSEQEDKVRQQVQRLERIIEDAPKAREKKEKREREELISRATEQNRRPRTSAVLPDKRYEAVVYPQQPRKSLKSEQQEGRLKFFGLCIVLIAMLLLLYKVWG